MPSSKHPKEQSKTEKRKEKRGKERKKGPFEDARKKKRHHVNIKTNLRPHISSILKDACSEASIELNMAKGTKDYLQILAEDIMTNAVSYMNSVKKKQLIGIPNLRNWITMHFFYDKERFIYQAERTKKLFKSFKKDKSESNEKREKEKVKEVGERQRPEGNNV